LETAFNSLIDTALYGPAHISLLRWIVHTQPYYNLYGSDVNMLVIIALLELYILQLVHVSLFELVVCILVNLDSLGLIVYILLKISLLR
jgi:hypothetical protein